MYAPFVEGKTPPFTSLPPVGLLRDRHQRTGKDTPFLAHWRDRTHSGNITGTPDLCDKLDRGLASLITDLHDRGLLKDTLVVVATEFGRTPTINGSLGRDHYPKAFSSALFGGGVKGGFVYGKTDKRGEEVETGEATIPDFNATLGYALGLPINEVVVSPEKRPFKLADKGRPISAVFA